MNDAELDDAGDPEILDAVVEAKLGLQRACAHRVGAQNQFMPVEMRQQVEGGVARQRAALVGGKSQQHLVEDAEVERGEDDGGDDEQQADRGDRRRKRGSPAAQHAEHPNATTQPMTSSTVTSAVRPPNTISDARQNAISGSRNSTGGQSAGRSTSARI